MINEASGLNPSNEFLKKLAEDLGNNPPKDENQGHEKLMMDLCTLVVEAAEYQFHDFRNAKYAAPKIELRTQLLKLADNVVNGRYDN